jgi:hypothetical protein
MPDEMAEGFAQPELPAQPKCLDVRHAEQAFTRRSQLVSVILAMLCNYAIGRCRGAVKSRAPAGARGKSDARVG